MTDGVRAPELRQAEGRFETGWCPHRLHELQATADAHHLDLGMDGFDGGFQEPHIFQGFHHEP